LQLFDHGMQVEPDDLGEIEQFDDVQPPLALLDVRDERLMSSQRLRDLCLRHAGLVPLRDQQLREFFVARGVDGLGHRPPDKG
jgi:hypothetical protein